MRNDAGMEKPSQFVPALSVPPFTEQIPDYSEDGSLFPGWQPCAQIVPARQRKKHDV